MTAELTTTDLKEVVIASKIELTKAESIAANYSPILAEVQEQMTIVKTLVKGEAAHVDKAKRVRIDLGRIASKAANQKKIDKEDLLLQTRFIDALFNTVEGAARITQGEAKEIEEYFEKQEAERKAEDERLAKIEAEKKAAELAAKAPVKVQLNKWIDGFVMGTPDGLNDEVVVKVISAKFESFKSWAKAQIDSI